MHSKYVSWSRTALLAGLVLALVVIVPFSWFPFQLFKLAAFALCLAIAVGLFVLGGGARDLLRTHGLRAALLVALLPVLYFISSRFSVDPAVAMTGFGIETDTIVFVTFAAIAYLMAFTLFRTLRTAGRLLSVVYWTLAAAAVFQGISLLFGFLIPFEVFADRSVNLVGKWNDFGLLCSLLAVLTLTKVELSALSGGRRAVAVGATAALLVLLGLVNFVVAWGLFLAGCIIVAALSYLNRRAAQGDEGFEGTRVPWLALAGAAVSILFLLYGATFNVALTKLIPVSSLEIRPSLQATMAVSGEARKGFGQTLIGTGPNTFGGAWLMYKPAEVNQTPFWNLDFNVGFSTVTTALLSVGFLGALAWLLPLLLVLAAVVRVMRLGVLSREERSVALPLILAAAFLMAAAAVYVPSQNLIVLGFVLSGAVFGFLWRQGRSAVEEAPPTMLRGIAVLATAAALVVFTLAATVATERRFVAAAYTGAGFSAIEKGNIDRAISLAVRAQAWDTSTDAARLRIEAGRRSLTAISSDTSLPREEAQRRAQKELEATVAAAQKAIVVAPQDYRGYFALAGIYDFLASQGVQAAYENAVLAYTAAAQRNPTSPAIALATARLEARQGKLTEMQEHLTRALTLKPNYTDAILFTVQFNVAQNDLPSALRNAAAAVESAPGVPTVWFQLGLLHYVAGDTKNAVPALEGAIARAPDYANAKYFLGLSYFAEGRTTDAQKVFEDLVATHPENTEIKLILSNLKEGRQPLAGVATPTISESAPINE